MKKNSKETSYPSPRPGFVLDVDRNTPPIVFHHGESFRLEKLPTGRSRVVYPSEPLFGIQDPEGAIKNALLNLFLKIINQNTRMTKRNLPQNKA